MIASLSWCFCAAGQVLCGGGSRPSHHSEFGEPSVRGRALGLGSVQNRGRPEDTLGKIK